MLRALEFLSSRDRGDAKNVDHSLFQTPNFSQLSLHTKIDQNRFRLDPLSQDKALDLYRLYPLAVLDPPTGIQDHFLAGFDTVENLDFGAAGASGFDCP
jgi:hypothetical protein